MNDLELLEMAAKAAGLVHEGFSSSLEDSRGQGLGLWSSSNGYSYWNPLTNDGDALRLAVMLNLLIDSCGMAARPLDDNIGWIDGDGETACQRVRSAITKVAAEIGRNMP